MATVPPSLRLCFDVGGHNVLKSIFRKGRGPALAVEQPLCALVVASEASEASEDAAIATIQCPVKSVLVEINPRAIAAQGRELLRYADVEFFSLVLACLLSWIHCTLCPSFVLRVHAFYLRRILHEEYVAIVEVSPAQLTALRQRVDDDGEVATG